MSEKLAHIEKKNGRVETGVRIEPTPEALSAALNEHGLLHGLADLPEAMQDFFAVVRGNIVVGLVRD